MALVSNNHIPELGATGFECADGGPPAQPPSGKSELIRSKKCALWCAITITFGLSVALGFSVLGPVVAKYAKADSQMSHQDYGKAVEKYAFWGTLPSAARGHRVGVRTRDAKMEESAERVSGTVKWFDSEKGYGFITPREPLSAGGDMFVHWSGVAGDGFKSLADGEAVEFKKVYNEQKNKWEASDVTGPGGDPVQGSSRAFGYDQDGY